jgi:hypothetical protein
MVCSVVRRGEARSELHQLPKAGYTVNRANGAISRIYEGESQNWQEKRQNRKQHKG